MLVCRFVRWDCCSGFEKEHGRRGCTKGEGWGDGGGEGGGWLVMMMGTDGGGGGGGGEYCVKVG